MTIPELLDSEWLEKSKSLIQTPYDFKKWMDLISYAENLNGGIVKNSPSQDKFLLFKSYENFLTQFPNCEKIWCNFADWKFKLGDSESCYKIYLKLISVIPHSLIIWNSYLNFLQYYKSGDLKILLGELEKARLNIGLHYYSDSFYDLYLSFLYNNQLSQRYFNLLRRVLEIPLYNYSKYFIKWFNLIENASVDDIKLILSTKDLQERFQLKDFSSTSTTSTTPSSLPQPPSLSPSHLANIKSKLKKLFIDLYITTQYHSYQFYHFEKHLLKNNYFDPRKETDISKKSDETSERNPIDIWESYLTYMETLLLNHSNTKDKLNHKIQLHYINFLYERCLIPNCYVRKIWIKYINFQISISNLQKAIEINERALSYYIPNDLQLTFKLIELYQLTKQIDKAHFKSLELYKLYPNNVPVFIKLLTLEDLMNKTKQNSDRLLELVSKKLSSSSLADFQWLFYEIQHYKNISLIDLLKFYDSYLDSTHAKTSILFWKIVLNFVNTHYRSDLIKYIDLAKEKYAGDDDQFIDYLNSFTADEKSEGDLKWLDRF